MAASAAAASAASAAPPAPLRAPLLISDVGGTNARFELHLPGGSACFRRTYPTVGADAAPGAGSQMEALVARFLADAGAAGHPPPALCVLAVCGPVVDGAAYCASQVMLATTGAWQFTEASVRAAAGGVDTVLINDFVAVGHALETIAPEQLTAVYLPPQHSDAGTKPICCLGPGTGLGNVFAVWDDALGRRRVLPSEGCMSSFVSRTPLQFDFFQFVADAEGGFVPVDRLVSGQGIASWYAFFMDTEAGARHLREQRGIADRAAACDPAVREEVRASAQPAGVVARHDAAGDDPVCSLCIDCFLDTLGQEAANMGMRYLAHGGVYIAGGGIAPKMFARIMDGRVRRAYLAQGVSSGIVAGMPLYVSSATDCGLAGALSLGRSMLKS